jgi:hypothetical protein
MAERETSLQEVAEQRGLELRTLQAAAKSGRLRARKVAGVWLVRVGAVDRWLADAPHRPGPALRPKGSRENAPVPEVEA